MYSVETAAELRVLLVFHKSYILIFCIFFALPLLNAKPRVDGSHKADVAYPDSPSFPGFKIMSMAQSGFTTAEKRNSVDAYKRKMLDGLFDYTTNEQISGEYLPSTDTYYVLEGHTRLAAALEIGRENGDWSHFKKLVQAGKWDKTNRVPPMTYLLPIRKNLLNFLNCRSIVKELAH